MAKLEDKEKFGEHGEIWRTWRDLENMEKFREHGECLALYRGEHWRKWRIVAKIGDRGENW